MKILVLDNYDSFTYNLVHILEELGLRKQTDVIRNDKIDLSEVEKYDKILLSPGPGLPSEAGIMPALIERYAPHKSILGICLGHQAIGECFGAKLYNRETVLHGIATLIHLESKKEPLFRGLEAEIVVGRYHSWAIEPTSVGKTLSITARDKEGEPMAIRHVEYDVAGLQFHPESILTPHGKRIIYNWIQNGKHESDTQSSI